MNDFDHVRKVAREEGLERALRLASTLAKVGNGPIKPWHVHNLYGLMLTAYDPHRAIRHWADDHTEPLHLAAIRKAA